MDIPITSFSGNHRFLSNFYIPPVEIEFEGILFPTTEHAYQAAKTFDNVARRDIARLSTPGKAKRMGRVLEIRNDWEYVKVSVMESLLVKKFSIPEMRDLLLTTRNSYLIEGNNWGDRIWGAVFNMKTGKFEGDNILGKLLMKIREQIK